MVGGNKHLNTVRIVHLGTGFVFIEYPHPFHAIITFQLN